MKRTYTFAIPLVLILAGCASKPTTPDSLAAAQHAVEQAEQNPAVARYAPVQLNEAQEALRSAERATRAEAPSSEIDHLSFLASRKAQNAEAIARREQVLASAQDTQEERQRILLESREQAAQRARQQAEQARMQAQQLQNETEQLRQQQAEMQQALQDARAQLSELQPKQTERGVVLTLNRVQFPFDSAQLQPGDMRQMERLADYLQQHPDLNVLIEGYTDSVGDEAYNERLSERRAQAVRNALARYGIEADRVRAIGMGESFPVDSNASTEGRANNRRVELVLNEGNMPMTREEQRQATRREQMGTPRG